MIVTPLPCIYCRRKDVPRTKEHVLQKSFGASATLIHQVCADCNSAFSTIDKTFVQAVDFYYRGHKMLRGMGLGRHVLADGTVVNATVNSEGSVSFPPQLYEVTKSTWNFFGFKEADRTKMFEELAKPDELKVTTRVVSNLGQVPGLLILTSGPFAYVILGPDPARLDAFKKKVLAQGIVPESIGKSNATARSDPPPISFDTKLDLDAMGRAMAKIALNFVCHRLGASIALQEQFDPIRQFILGKGGHFADFVAPTILNHELTDALSPFVEENHHALFLMVDNSESRAVENVGIAIGGKTIGWVKLTQGNTGLPPGTWLLTRFNEQERTYDDLDMHEDFLRAALKPELLGLSEIWPQS